MNRIPCLIGLSFLVLISGCSTTQPSTTIMPDEDPRAFNPRYVSIKACRNWTNLVDRERTKEEKIAAIHMDLGVGYWQQQSYSIALKELNRSIEANPNSAATYNARALLNRTLGRTDAAERDFRQSLEIEPGNPNTHNNFGTFLCDQDDFKHAIAHFECAIASPLYSTPYLALANAGACAAKSDRPKRAVNYLKTAIQLEPRFPTPYLDLAEIDFKNENYEQAQERLKQFANLSKPTARSLYLGYKNELALGNREPAAKLASRLKFQFPQSNEADLLISELAGE